MKTILRYAGLALAILVLSIVFTVCGDPACGACLHACCVRSDRTDRTATLLGRVIAACTASVRPFRSTGPQALTLRPGALAIAACAPPFAGGGLPLRI